MSLLPRAILFALLIGSVAHGGPADTNGLSLSFQAGNPLGRASITQGIESEIAATRRLHLLFQEQYTRTETLGNALEGRLGAQLEIAPWLVPRLEITGEGATDGASGAGLALGVKLRPAQAGRAKLETVLDLGVGAGRYWTARPGDVWSPGTGLRHRYFFATISQELARPLRLFATFQSHEYDAESAMQHIPRFPTPLPLQVVAGGAAVSLTKRWTVTATVASQTLLEVPEALLMYSAQVQYSAPSGWSVALEGSALRLGGSGAGRLAALEVALGW